MNYDEQSVLDATYLEGMFNERKRIIALLTEQFPTGWDYAEKDPIASVIALIKGDNK